jgi:ankyrin repeat protein
VQRTLRKIQRIILIQTRFLLVHLNFEFVHQAQDAVDLQYNLDDIEKMPYANGQDTEDYLEQVLSEAYKRNLERILHRDRGRTNVNYARLILAFLRDAIRPLSLEELQCLLQIKIRSDGFTSLSRPSQDIIQAACQGLVNIGPEGSNTIGFIHQSLHRYLEQEKGGKKHIPDESENLGRRCAWFLASDACQEGICIDEKSLETRLKEHPLLNYAARYWKDHLKEFEKLLADNSKEASYDPGTFHALTLEFLLKDAHVESSAQILRFPDKFLAPLIQRPKNSKTVPKQMLFLLVNKDMVAAHNSYQRTSTVGLHLASRHGFQTLVNRILIAEPRQINCIDSDGWTPLHHAAFGGHTPVVRELLHYGAKPDGLKLGISTPLMLATRYNHKETIDVLFNSSRGFDVNMPTQRPDFVTKSFTMATIEVNFDDEVGAPMISGLATEYTQPYGRTLLQTAAREDNIELMERLLQDPQLDKDIQDGDGRTALHTAAKKGKLRAVKLLIERGADHTSRVLCDRYGQPSTAESIKEEWYQNSVLHMAGMYDRGCSVAQYLIQKFPELLNQVNGHREVPLHLAAGNGQAKMVEELLKHTGIDINARDNRGYTPLHLAMNLHGKQWEICIQLLLHYPGVEINTTCDNGETPLATAIRLGRPRYVKLLSEHLNTHPVAPPASVNAESKLNDKTLKEVSLNHPIQEHGVAAHESMSQSNASSSAE